MKIRLPWRRRHRTPWEKMIAEEARKHAVVDRAELEALEAEVLEHHLPAAVPAAKWRKTRGKRRRR